MRKFLKYFCFSLVFMVCIFAVTFGCIAILIKIIDILYVHGLPIWQQYLIVMGGIGVITSLILSIYGAIKDHKKGK